MSEIRVLAAVHSERAARYKQEFSSVIWVRAHVLSCITQAVQQVETFLPQILVLDQAIDGASAYLDTFRQQFPHIMIILVDEDADFALPGIADDIATTPFKEGDLLRRIRRLLANRQMETLRADAMPPVHDLNKRLRKAIGEQAKAQEAVNACLNLGFVYAALYRMDSRDPIQVNLVAQCGASEIQLLAPQQVDDTQAVGWVAKTGQSRVLNPADNPGHPLIPKYLSAAAIVPVGVANRYGTLFAAKNIGSSVQQQDLLMLELVAAQLASTLAKES